MRRRIVFIDDQAAPGDFQGTGRVVFAIAPMLERALSMGERQAGVGARECWGLYSRARVGNGTTSMIEACLLARWL